MTGTDGEKIRVLHWHLAWMLHAVFLPPAPSLEPLASEPSLRARGQVQMPPAVLAALPPSFFLALLSSGVTKAVLCCLHTLVSQLRIFLFCFVFGVFWFWFFWFLCNSNKPVGLWLGVNWA